MRNFMLLVMTVALALGAGAQTSRIYIEDFEIQPGTMDTVTVKLAAVQPSRGLQFNITLPSGLDVWDCEVTDLSAQYHMVGSCDYNSKNNCYSAFIYPTGQYCYPTDTVVEVLYLIMEADPSFSGGDLITWKCRGSTMDNTTIVMDGDTTHVSLPSASIIAVPEDNTPMWQQYYNLNGQPIASPDSSSVAIQVTTNRRGERSARKVAVGH